MVVALLTVGVGYFVNLVTANPPQFLQAWSGQFLVLLVALTATAVVWQARATGGESPDRQAAERRRAVSGVLGVVQSTLDDTFASAPRLPLALRGLPHIARPGKDQPAARDHTDLATVFEETGRGLLLLGAGGGGKSTLMAELCARLCRDEMERDTPHVPVLVTLDTWSDGPFARWLADAIVDAYPGVRPATAARWVADRVVIPLIDGLEATGSGRDRFLESLDQFLREAPCPVALSCRADDFAGAEAPATLSYAVEVRKPDRDQVIAYLRALRSPAADAVIAVSDKDTRWWSMVREPLMLGVIAHLAVTRPERPLVDRKARHRRRHILRLYVDSLIDQGGPRPPWGRDEVRRWTTWLARWMSNHGRTEFYVDRIPAKWLAEVMDARFGSRHIRRLLMRTLFVTVTVGAITSALVTPIHPLYVLLNVLPVLLATAANLRRNYVSDTMPIRLAWSIRGRWAVAIGIGAVCLSILLALQVVLGSPLAAGHIVLVTLAATVLNIPAVLPVVIRPQSRPNRAGAPPGARIRRSLVTAWRGALFVGVGVAVLRCVLMAPAYGWATAAAYTVPFGIICGVSCWLVFGGLPVLEYRALFAALRKSGRGPADYLDFLDWAQARRLLRPSGSALRFPHREVQEYLAGTWTTPVGR